MATLELQLQLDFADLDGEGDSGSPVDADADIAALENDFGGGSEDENVAEDAMEVDEEQELAEELKQKQQQAKPSGNSRLSKGFMAEVDSIMKEIEHYTANPAQVTTTYVEDNPEYELLSKANMLSSRIDNEFASLHKTIRDHYSVKFPYLEELIQNPLDYAKAVAIIQNGPLDDIKNIAQNSDNLVGVALKDILVGPSLMVVALEATRAEGRDLNKRELSLILEACSNMIKLEDAKKRLTEYVQSRIEYFAPNLTALVDKLTAAQLLNAAGGLTGLAKTPACNLAPLGSNKATNTGFATNTGTRKQGFLYYSELIQNLRPDLKTQAIRALSAKVILAARVDSVHEFPDGSAGRDFREQCVRRIDKLTEPSSDRGVRALPVPDDKPSRKRGGRRARKAKEATAVTDIRKQQNRMAFGKEEKEVGYGDTTKGLGMIGAPDTGRVRSQQIDQRTRAKLSKKNPGWGAASAIGTASAIGGLNANNPALMRLHGLRAAGVGGQTALGTSSIAFTPVQGLELVDPKAREENARKRKAEEDRWFKDGTFTAVGPAKVDSAGFKVPGLPASKKQDTGATKEDK